MPKHQLEPKNWVNLHSDYLFNYAVSRVNDREIAQDLVSETFLAGLKSKANFKGEASERTWLISILKRKVIDYYRKINSNKGKTEVKIPQQPNNEDGNWLEQQVADNYNASAEDELLNTELGNAIYNCIDKLPPKQAQVFKMKSLLNYDTETICKELNITASNLWVLIHRARTALANCMENTWYKS